MIFRSSSLLIAAVVAAASTTTTVLAGNTAHDSCDTPEWVPLGGTTRPTALRCCKGTYGTGSDLYGRCDTSSCVENFDSKNRNCFNYGSPQHPIYDPPSSMPDNKKDDAAGRGGGSHICPYKKVDRAICDTTFYNDYNSKKCRTNTNGGNTHCLGKVRCQSSGIYFDPNIQGSNPHSDGTPTDPAQFGDCSSEQYPAGTDCFYDGFSENWKVCLGPPEGTTDGGGGGDPHMLTWGGTYYDYMGICDLVLVEAPGFGNGLGFTAHIRTAAQPNDNWSYIESAAIKIGDDVLEVGSYGEIIYNGVGLADGQVFEEAKMAGIYKIDYEEKNKKERLVTVSLSAEDSTTDSTLTIRSWKQMVNVKFNNAVEHDFKDSVGMMGDFYEGALKGRDGVTLFMDENEFGQEWQVTAAEPMLFNSRPELEGKKCQLPTKLEVAAIEQKRLRRRLSETGVNQAAAELACAKFEGDQKEMCIYDVIATGDLEAAQGGAF